MERGGLLIQVTPPAASGGKGACAVGDWTLDGGEPGAVPLAATGEFGRVGPTAGPPSREFPPGPAMAAASPDAGGNSGARICIGTKPESWASVAGPSANRNKLAHAVTTHKARNAFIATSSCTLATLQGAFCLHSPRIYS